MIYLTKGQTLADNPAMVVYDPTGYYNDGDSVICASAGIPEEPVCRYEAKFIAYGGLVYSISDPDELMEQVLKIDPKSLFGKESQQIAVDKIVDSIVTQESGKTVDGASTGLLDTTGQASTTQQTTSTSTPFSSQTSTTTPQGAGATATSTTTPSGSGAGTGSGSNTPVSTASASSTPATSTSTTTPETLFSDGQSTTTPIDTSTTTPFETSTTTPFDTSTTTPGSIFPDVGITSTTTPTTTPPDILFSDDSINNMATSSSGVSTTTPAIDPSILTEASTTPPVAETINAIDTLTASTTE